ncbi:tRNA (N6-threonylcarbamoyladenosine(37)-N6)-methyltransferase TrmO [Solitalea canadensis]|uniref:Putative methyltransferase, YaeB/AF_0241 family n=1 Tax=Solitalea canadensis (strain ATCC 29591 / DSM 3403 / JCM 21819 / LMG 8368 / NBRC 15130 / NCIMB 12057 / USAM 9D) TaxID=929556 RepID=H8KM17_SOLCM|nr:tRNA (N6-threonylcarbamoyladenosine(37)-N6)-methyltransferase TrmO [Solitalea canadensis]AFD08939.1 putative methyltransferase, YaeB/AF_0241 family [Solitalea canadensis DSM 3403]
MDSIVLTPIGIIHSPFKEKFGIPRQPGLAPSSYAVVELIAPYNSADVILGLEQFSHLWIIFQFHETAHKKWTPTVRPPRLGGNKRMGVFATRSTHRPNPIGMSVAELEKIETENNEVKIYLRNIDLMDGTPVLDIKPYIPYSDAIPTATAGYAAIAPEKPLDVQFDPEIGNELSIQPELKQLIIEVLSFDPRPAYKATKDDTKIYGVLLENVDVKFKIDGSIATVISLERSA